MLADRNYEQVRSPNWHPLPQSSTTPTKTNKERQSTRKRTKAKKTYQDIPRSSSFQHADVEFAWIALRCPIIGPWAAAHVTIRPALGWKRSWKQRGFDMAEPGEVRRRQLSKLDVVDVLDEASLGILASKVASILIPGDWVILCLVSERKCFVILL